MLAGERRKDHPPICRSGVANVVSLGRLLPHRSLELLLHATTAVRIRWPDLRIEVVGDGAVPARLEQLVHELGLGDTVRLHGRVDETTKARLLARAWLAVHPSMTDGWGITVMDAAQVGVPSLAFDVQGLRDSILDGESGWLIPPGADLATGIDRALSELADPLAAERWGDRTRAWGACFAARQRDLFKGRDLGSAIR
jgi:glycosyltransferase involved in cell wall biosynthesis